MEAIALLDRAHAAGLRVSADGGMLVVRGPRSAEALARELLERKAEILSLLRPVGDDGQPPPLDRAPETGGRLAHLRRRTELIDLPWPIGYGGLPAEEVARAEATNDRLGVIDPVARRLNVLSWMRCHYRNLGDMEMAAKMREAYHELRHADPSIKALCGLCEYRDG